MFQSNSLQSAQRKYQPTGDFKAGAQPYAS